MFWFCSVWCFMETSENPTHTPLLRISQLQFPLWGQMRLFWLATYTLSLSPWAAGSLPSVLSFWVVFPGLWHPMPAFLLLSICSWSEICISGPLGVRGWFSFSWPPVQIASNSSARFSFFRSLRWESHTSPLTMCPNCSVLSSPRSIS